MELWDSWGQLPLWLGGYQWSKAQAKIGGCGEGDREEKSGGWIAGA